MAREHVQPAAAIIACQSEIYADASLPLVARLLINTCT